MVPLHESIKSVRVLEGTVSSETGIIGELRGREARPLSFTYAEATEGEVTRQCYRADQRTKAAKFQALGSQPDLKTIDRRQKRKDSHR
jgi:hypothetical protein